MAAIGSFKSSAGPTTTAHTSLRQHSSTFGTAKAAPSNLGPTSGGGGIHRAHTTADTFGTPKSGGGGGIIQPSAPKAPGTSGAASGLLGGVFEVMGKGGSTSGAPAAPVRGNGRPDEFMNCKGGGGSPGGVMDRGRNGL